MNNIKFVGLHAHSGVGSPFDGFGYPQDHMDFCFDNGGQALALTDHGNMNGFAYQILHAKKMKKQGKDFKPIFGVEAYFIPCVDQWRKEYEEHKADKKKAKALSQDQSGVNVEEEGATKAKGRSINRSRHLVLIAMNQTGLNNIFKLVSESYSEKYFYRKPRMDYQLLSKYSDGVIAMSACLGGVMLGVTGRILRMVKRRFLTACERRPVLWLVFLVIVGMASFSGMLYLSNMLSISLSLK